MAKDKFMTAEAAMQLVKDGDTLALVGGGGGLMEASYLLAALEKRFLQTGSPRNLTVTHSLGIGDKKERGTNRVAHEGMVKRVIGGHWPWSPRMQALARDEKIEAYALPGGVMMQLYRDIGAKRPGLITHVGLGTFVDPRLGGGRLNKKAAEDLVEVTQIDGKEYLRYKAFPVNVAFIRASFADDKGNLCMDQEAANIDMQAVALAAHNSGGKVIAQVKKRVPSGSLTARQIRIPASWVDAIVIDPDQSQTYDIAYDPELSGEKPDTTTVADTTPPPLDERQVIAQRAAELLEEGAVINYGFGVPDGIAKLIARRGELDRYYQTIEHGTYGGTLLDGTLFGFARGAEAMIEAPTQFDFYAGGGLDIAFLGFGEFDRHGNVNVSMLGGLAVGPGGFIDIAQNAKRVVFCGTFEAKGVRLDIGGGQLKIVQPGQVQKLVDAVDQITYSGPQGLVREQDIWYVTERAVFRLTKDGVTLVEIAPGVDLQRDVLDRMAFKPVVANPLKLMDSSCFTQSA